MTTELALTIRLTTSAADARRGVIRIHAEVLAALGLREWDAVSLVGARRTAAVVALAPDGTSTGTALLDDVTLSNVGLKENASVVISPATVYGAKTVTVSGSSLATSSITPSTLREALLGKVLTVGDTVSLLPRDLGPGTSTSATTQSLSRTFGVTWTTELLTVVAVTPSGGPVSVQPNSGVGWVGSVVGLQGFAAQDYAARGDAAREDVTGDNVTRATARAAPRVPIDDLVGSRSQAAKLDEWLDLALDQPELLRTLGASPRLGVLITGPGGVGKATLARAVAADRAIVEVDGPTVGSLAAEGRQSAVATAADRVRSGGILLITDVDALLPGAPEPVAALILEQLRDVVDVAGVALICTTAHPDSTDARLRSPDICDRVLSLPLPDGATRAKLLDVLLRTVPQTELNLTDIASRTPGFVVADLSSVCREAALRAASRANRDGAEPELTQDDLVGALDVIRPLSRSGTEELAVGSLTLDDVGDMVETKQALTEAVLWPLRHPDSFARLGVDPPRGVLLYGPPGCGKTFVVRALASSGQLSVHAVKGAELMDKWVGASEKAVRELFERARNSAPSLIFLDEVDALAPRRGQSSDSGVSDRVVAALLTELDGVEPLRDVVVLGATNRPELIDPALLRPGRLEKLVFVPPPDAQARRAILATSSKNIPLAPEVDLDALAEQLDGYSAADCSAVLREAALAAMRRSVDAASVSAADVDAARSAVRPSLDPVQVEALRRYATRA
ncbi:AAA family ATPase [Actinomycetes bacterium M1A6_2h]